MARYGMDYRNHWNRDGRGHDYSERGYTGSSWSGNRDTDMGRDMGMSRGDWHRGDLSQGGRQGMRGGGWNRGDEGSWGGYGGYEGDFGGRGTYEGGHGGGDWSRGSMGGYSSGYGRSGFRGGSGEWEREEGYAGRGEQDYLPWSGHPDEERFGRGSSGEGMGGGYRGRGMDMDRDHDLGDRMREGWHALKRGARGMMGGGRRGYDRGW